MGGLRVRPVSVSWLSVALGISVLGGCSSEPELSDGVQHFLAAQDAIARGDNETALQELNISIELEPDGWSYYQRAKIYREMGKDKEAIADCESGLKLDPDHVELKWLLAELRKPEGRRFPAWFPPPMERSSNWFPSPMRQRSNGDNPWRWSGLAGERWIR